MISLIGFGATRRETSAKTMKSTTTTTTTMTKRQNASDEKTNEHRIEAEIAFEKPNPIVDRIPAKQPKFEKREGEALTNPGNPLTTITTIKLSRKKTEDFEPKVCVCFLKCVL